MREAAKAPDTDDRRFSANVREMLAQARGLVHNAERFVEAAGHDSRNFGLPPLADTVNLGEYRRLTNAKGWHKLRL